MKGVSTEVFRERKVCRSALRTEFKGALKIESAYTEHEKGQIPCLLKLGFTELKQAFSQTRKKAVGKAPIAFFEAGNLKIF